VRGTRSFFGSFEDNPTFAGQPQLACASLMTGQLQETITLPRPRPTAPPPTETLTFAILSADGFNVMLLNPTHWARGPGRERR
jgi:hypothetical protein